MTPPAIPEGEAERLALLRKHRLDITGREAEFDRIVASAADLFDCPIALVNLILEDDQRTLGACGMPNADMPRDIAFCAHTILSRDVLVVEDAEKDPRFSANPIVTGSPHIRFYAGAPLMLGETLSVGSLCLLDTRPRTFGAPEIRRLTRMAETVVDMMRLRLGALGAAEAQERLSAQRNLLSATIERIEHGVLVLDASLHVRTFNDNFFRILELPDALKTVGTSYAAIVEHLARRGAFGAGAAEALVAARLASLRRGEAQRDVLELPGGRSVEAWRAAAAAGRFVIVVTDISARRRVERMKDEFISTVSHELRTPLTSIAGSLGLLAAGAGGTLDPKGRRLLDIARSNSDRLVRIINDLLDIGKAEAGKIDLDMASLDLAAAVRQAAEQNAPYADRFGVRIETDAEEPHRARADPHRLQQILGNLISNAVKFSPAGGVVRVTLRSHGVSARLSVSDEGPGVPESFRDRLFTKFAQADASDRRARGGTGLGLSIARSLAEAMNGSIGYTTEIGRGTTFHVDLPLQEPPARAAADPRRGVGSVLLVRDAAHVERFGRALREAGLSVREAVSLDAALAVVAASAEDERPAALLVDINQLMTGGAALAERVAEIRRATGAPVVLVSAAPERPGGGDAAAAPEPEPARRGVRILHVEDDLDLCGVVERALSPIGEVVCVHDLASARRAVAEQEFDVAILDIGLPDGSGADLIQPLKQTARPAPIIVFSAYDADEATAAQVAAFLTKSRDSVLEMAETVRRIVGAERAKDGEGTGR